MRLPSYNWIPRGLEKARPNGQSFAQHQTIERHASYPTFSLHSRETQLKVNSTEIVVVTLILGPSHALVDSNEWRPLSASGAQAIVGRS